MSLCSRALYLLVSVPALLSAAACESGSPAPPPPPASAAVAEFQPAGGAITLRDGATLQLPTGAQVSNAPGWLPETVLKTQVYRLGGAERLLTVNELDLKGRTCSAILAAEWSRLSAAQPDPEEQPRLVTAAEQHTVQGRRVLYSERRPAGSDALLSTAVLCEGQNHVALIYAVDQAGQAGEAKKLLLQIAGSYQPAGA